MNTYKASNVPLEDFRRFLVKAGCKMVRNRKGHYIYEHPSVNRTFPIQSHIDPVPKFIVLEILNHLNMSSKQMWEMIKRQKGTTKRKSDYAKRGKRAREK